MKKVLLVSAIAGLAFVSCKKDYTCKCTASENGSEIYSASYTAKMKKSDADSWCSNNSSTIDDGSGTVIKSTCKLQ